MKRYDSYKDSGVKWLGEIPSHWGILPGLAVFKENKTKNTELSEKTVLSLSYGNIIIKKDIDEGLVPADYKGYQIVHPGYIIIRCTDLQNDKVSLRTGLVKNDGIITGAYLGLKVDGSFNSSYVHYFLHSWDITKEIYRHGSGLRQSLSWFDLRRLPILIPSREEQDKIVSYLNDAVSKIDEAIAQQQKMIDLLNERKQIIINNAVTKGLNPNAPMKDSGIDWIGQIPAHWNVAALKRYVKLTNGDRGSNYPSGDEIKDSGILFVTADNIHNLVLDITSSAKYITEEKYNTLRGAKMRIGDIIFCLRGAGFGNCAINNTFEEGTIASSLVCITPRDINGYFLNYVLHSEFIRTQEINSSNGSCADNVSAQNLGDYMIIIPPLNEQKQIVDHIAQFDTSIDSVINMASKQISLLQERKQIIINDVVTGKVKVI